MAEKKEKKVVDYFLAWGDRQWVFEAIVCQKIYEGWEPVGGAFLGKLGGFYQAMIKKEIVP